MLKLYTSVTRVYAILIAIASISLTGCKKFIEVDLPIDKITSDAIFSNTSTAVSALSGVYANIGGRTSMFVGNSGISIRLGLMADELTPDNPAGYPEYTNSITGNLGWNPWVTTYRDNIFRLNSIIEGVSRSTALAADVKQVLIGEAKFTRAFLYFYLVNLYGDVPLVLTTTLKDNASIPRTDQSLVYAQIIKDLIEAREVLANDYLNADLSTISSDRVRPNKLAASALLARVYLYTGKFQEAEDEASKIIGNSNYELISDLNGIFLINSKEAIWQLQCNPLDPDGANTQDGRYLINPRRRNPRFAVSTHILGRFHPTDNRAIAWTNLSPSGTIIAYKYKEGWGTFTPTEYTMVLRLAEQYLIRAEARAYLNKLTGDNSAEQDLNAIRSRAGLASTTATTQQELLDAILAERQLEFFTEWGHRWLDLKRTGKIDEVMQQVTAEKTGSWAPYKAFLPIPYSEFQYNTALRGHQNEGYTERP